MNSVPDGLVERNLSAIQETQAQSLCWEDPLEEEIATHSSILGWEIPWTDIVLGIISHPKLIN